MFASDVLVSNLAKKAPPTQVSVAYGVFFVGVFMVYHFVANGEFSSILTMSVMFQCLAFCLLGMQQWTRNSAAGISAQSLILEAISFICRLSSTTWLNGYLPVDASGDFVYQLVDFCSLMLVLWLLYRVLVAHRHSYEAEKDSLPILPMVLGSLVLAAFLHADMNNRPIFDTLWMTGLFTGVVSVLPQLYLIIQTGGVIQACTSHYIAMMAVSRVLSGTFMWHARFDVTCAPWIEGFSHAIWAILAAHAIHLLLLADFTYYYVKAVIKQGLSCQIELPAAMDMV